MAHLQGKLDYLCGPYAIVNAFEQAGVTDYSERLFKAACKAAAPRLWPAILWQGVNFKLLRAMIEACNDEVPSRLKLKVEYPFLSRNRPVSDREYWRAYDALFRDKSVLSGIVGMEEPHFHWLAIRPSARRIYFIDSDGEKNLTGFKYRKSIYAGAKKRKPNHWLIAPSELVLFSRAS